MSPRALTRSPRLTGFPIRRHRFDARPAVSSSCLVVRPMRSPGRSVLTRCAVVRSPSSCLDGKESQLPSGTSPLRCAFGLPLRAAF